MDVSTSENMSKPSGFYITIDGIAGCKHLPQNMRVSRVKGVPLNHHPFCTGIFPNKNHPAIGGTPTAMETHINHYQPLLAIINYD